MTICLFWDDNFWSKIFNLLQNESFKLNAFYMERLLNQNTYQPKQARYRGLKQLAAELERNLAGIVLTMTYSFF